MLGLQEIISINEKEVAQRSKLKKHEIFVGLNSNISGIIEKEYALNIAFKIMKELNIEGCTILDSIGVWHSEIEKSLDFVFLDTSIIEVQKFAEKIKQELEQESVLIVSQKVNYDFI